MDGSSSMTQTGTPWRAQAAGDAEALRIAAEHDAADGAAARIAATVGADRVYRAADAAAGRAAAAACPS